MSEEIYDPRERLEIFLNAIRTGVVDDLPDPQTREEMYLLAIASKSALPDPTDASAGDALTLDNDKNPTWSAISKEFYNHNITLKITKSSANYYATFNVISSRSDDYTKETLHSYMINTIQGDTRASEIHPQDIYYDGGPKQIPSIRFSSSPAYNIKFQVVTLSDGSNTGWIDTTVWSIVSDYCYKIQ